MPELLILYTANLRGDLEALPRLFTLAQRLRRGQASGAETLFFDLGGACDPGVWHCAVTGGRSMLLALDAMGWHAARVSGALDDETRAKLAANLLALALVDEQRPWRSPGGVVAHAGLSEPVAAALLVDLNPQPETRLAGRFLTLRAISGGQIGLARLGGSPLALRQQAVIDLPPDTPPDATISAAVDFVRREAAFYQRKTAGYP